MYNNILKEKNACLFLNGEIKDYKRIKNIYEKNEYGLIIAVDGGANHLMKMEIVPDYIIGDLDSIEKDTMDYFLKNNSKVKKFPEKKNETDCELAVLLCDDLDILSIDIYAARGDRIDHELGNIFLLDYIQNKNIYPRILTENQEVYIVENDELRLEGNINDLVSIIPIKGDANGVTLKNFEYELENFNMEYSVPRGISNVMKENLCHILVEKGILLVIKTCI